jgi:acetoin utilization deacetylase AcuC-like enzyme
VRVYYCDHFVLPLPDNHRFPMEKYALLRTRVAGVAPELGADLRVPRGATQKELLRVHSPAYVRAVTRGTLPPDQIRRIGFPWSPGLVERSRRSVGGSIEAARAALDDSVAVNLAGGTHHAFRDRGEGFCVFNDVAVAIGAMRSEGRARRVAVVDLDVHQGNGTAAIFADDPDTFTASVHGASNFPFHKTDGDLDIALPDFTGDERYLSAVEQAVDNAVFRFRPELVFYVAGADAFAGDRLGRLSVSKEGLGRRDELLTDACRSVGTAVAVVMAGGYAETVNDTVDIHFQSVVTALGGARHTAGATLDPFGAGRSDVQAYSRITLRDDAAGTPPKDPPSPTPGS